MGPPEAVQWESRPAIRTRSEAPSPSINALQDLLLTAQQDPPRASRMGEFWTVGPTGPPLTPHIDGGPTGTTPRVTTMDQQPDPTTPASPATRPIHPNAGARIWGTGAAYHWVPPLRNRGRGALCAMGILGHAGIARICQIPSPSYPSQGGFHDEVSCGAWWTHGFGFCGGGEGGQVGGGGAVQVGAVPTLEVCGCPPQLLPWLALACVDWSGPVFVPGCAASADTLGRKDRLGKDQLSPQHYPGRHTGIFGERGDTVHPTFQKGGRIHRKGFQCRGVTKMLALTGEALKGYPLRMYKATLPLSASAIFKMVGDHLKIKDEAALRGGETRKSEWGLGIRTVRIQASSRESSPEPGPMVVRGRSNHPVIRPPSGLYASSFMTFSCHTVSNCLNSISCSSRSPLSSTRPAATSNCCWKVRHSLEVGR